MPDLNDPTLRLAADLVAIDSRSFVSNLPVAERVERELRGFEVERLDYRDAKGVAKRAIVAHRGPKGGYALSGHLDTVPATGWESDPWAPRIDAEGVMHGLGSVDMKGQVAAAIVAAQHAGADVPVTLLITADEETTKQGAHVIATRSALAKSLGLKGIIVAEPTSLAPVRGHRSHIAFTATAHGVQAHSSTGKGDNANWKLLPFLAEMRSVFDRLRSDVSLQDADYEPPFSDFNLILDNHGTALNVTVARATAHIKFRYSAKVDPGPVLEAVRGAAQRAGLELAEQHEGKPPELPADHPLVALGVALTGVSAKTAPYGTDASELQALAPCLVLGPGDVGTAHTPHERVRAQDLLDAVPLFGRVLEAGKG
ncbi:M20/M25/M40 family metallo-hydrolase [Falsiroseomonas sp. HW251]|uniref:M20/M25/M40 family metallo-hydrolase n=1 Tax=Falsiroseomonas sp. HW251 TaxID=3390998 RepID=UPI003D31F68C